MLWCHRELGMFQELYKWIDSSLEGDVTNEVQGFCFNLIENGGLFFVELIGSSKFNKDDEDWACEEFFVAKQRAIEIPEDISGGHWEKCLESMTAILQNYLASNSLGAIKLNKVKGIGIGFIDGSLSLLTLPNSVS